MLHIGGARTTVHWLLAGLGRRCSAHRGHRPRALDGRRADPRCPSLARARLGRGPISQAERRSERATIGGAESGAAYEDEGAIRLSVPDEGETVVRDAIRGDITFPHSAIDDFVIRRWTAAPANTAVAVDDRDMGITRGAW